MRHSNWIKISGIVIGLIYTASIQAESYNPFAGTTVMKNSGGAPGVDISDPIVASSVGNVNSIQNTAAEDAVQGRQQKTDNTINYGNQGTGAAIAAGTSLMAAGMPMIASPILPVRLRGYDLIAKGALEFAQAGATSDTTGQNTGNKGTISQGQNGVGQSGGSQIYEQGMADAINQLNTPEFQQALGNAGVNSDYFLSQVTSGNAFSAADIANLANEQAEFTPDQLAMAGSETSGFVGAVVGATENNEPIENSTITFDENLSAVADGNASAAARSVNGPASSNAVTPTDAAALASASGTTKEKAKALAQAEIAFIQKNGGGGLLGLDTEALIAKYMKKGAKSFKAVQTNLSPDQLAEQGVKKLRGKQNIFHVGKKTYRSFGKWRKDSILKGKLARR